MKIKRLNELKEEKRTQINGYVFFVIPISISDTNDIIVIFDENGDFYKDIEDAYYNSKNIIDFIVEFTKTVGNKNLYKIEIEGGDSLDNPLLDDFYDALLDNYYLKELNLETLEEEAAFHKLNLEYKKL